MGRHQYMGTARPSAWSHRVKRPRFRYIGAVLVLVASALTSAGTGFATADQVPPGATADSGATVTSQTAVSSQMLDLTVASDQLNGSTPVRLLLPPSWDSEPDRTYPVLYLMHGCCLDVDNKMWTNATDVAQFMASRDVIVVMPGGGDSGYYSDHWNYGSDDHRSDAETFHTQELPQILQRGYRADTNRMAVAGLSLAGYGAMEYAARHPGLFKSAATYSGYPETQLPGISEFLMTAVLRNEDDPLALWGHPLTQANIWADHNPGADVSRLKGVNMFVSSGNGLPEDVVDSVESTVERLVSGVAEPSQLLGSWLGLEPLVIGTGAETLSLTSSLAFTTKLRLAGIPVTTDYYGNGVHDWPYWSEEFKKSWPVLAQGLGVPA